MSICKECIHFKICKYYDNHLTEEDIKAGQDIKDLCQHFKARSKLIELPCKVGDLVYFIETHREKQGRKNVYTDFVESGVIDRFIIGESNILMADICTSENSWYGIEAKTVFLTKEEAEKAIIERKRTHNEI